MKDAIIIGIILSSVFGILRYYEEKNHLTEVQSSYEQGYNQGYRYGLDDGCVK